MKLKTLRAHWHKDNKRGVMIERKKGEEFELDPGTESQIIFELLGALRVEVIDEKYVPASDKYKIIHHISYQTKEGFDREGKPGDEVELPQSVACRLMVSNHIRPVNEKQWRPSFLLGDATVKSGIKKMHDDDEPGGPKEDWVRKWGVRSGRE